MHDFLFGGGLGEFGSGAVGDRLQFLNGNRCAEFAGEGVVLGRLRDLTGLAEEAGELPEGATLAQVFERYAERYPKLAGFRNSMVVSRNQEFAAWDTRVSAGDEIAFLPPVSGG